ncbi:MAG: DUF3084 domain-containing protein [Chroococcus sp. CMT-3BRIN-NPC107]|nr:DUF3084 domain-containing protein [Chroococcus sp. CMT-3BRIN-NPC107]
MTTGIILIVAILMLGGVIATVGDRIGTRVGKARLSLFKLRPRKTAVLVTIFTGSIISASTLAILFAADKSLRTGVFELEKIQADLKTKRQQVESTTKELEATKIQKSNVEKDLQQARAEQQAAQKRQAQAQRRLQATNQSLQAVITKQTQTQAQLSRTQVKQAQTQAQLSRTQVKQAQTQAQLSRNQAQLSQITTRFLNARALLQKVSQQAKSLRSEIQKLQNERQQISQQLEAVQSQIAERDEAISKLDGEIANRDRVIAGRETRLKQLESQREFLEQEVAKLEGYYQDYQVLRQGNVALESGRVLALGVVRIQQPTAARRAIEQLLREANRVAIESTQPGTNPENELAVQISKVQVEQVIARIDDGRDYVVRVISAGNYLLGEKNVQAEIDVAVNKVIFSKGDVLAAIPTNPAIAGQDIRQKVGLLLSAAKFRARRAGILGDAIEIGDGRLETLVGFIEQVRQYNQPVEIKAIAAGDIYTAGPSQVQLVAVKNGQVVFGTRRLIGNQLRDALKPSLTKAGRATNKKENQL